MRHLFRSLILCATILCAAVSVAPVAKAATCADNVYPNIYASANADGSCPQGSHSVAAAATSVSCLDNRTNVTTVVQGQCPSGSTQLQDNMIGKGATNTNLGYVPLEPLPGEPDMTARNVDFGSILAALFKILIVVGGLVAVAALVVGGIIYMVSDVVNKKTEAKRRIKAAVWGLVLLLASYLILNTINPQLINSHAVLTPAPSIALPSRQQNTNPLATPMDCVNEGGDPYYGPNMNCNAAISNTSVMEQSGWKWCRAVTGTLTGNNNQPYVCMFKQ